MKKDTLLFISKENTIKQTTTTLFLQLLLFLCLPICISVPGNLPLLFSDILYLLGTLMIMITILFFQCSTSSLFIMPPFSLSRVVLTWMMSYLITELWYTIDSMCLWLYSNLFILCLISSPFHLAPQIPSPMTAVSLFSLSVRLGSFLKPFLVTGLLLMWGCGRVIAPCCYYNSFLYFLTLLTTTICLMNCTVPALIYLL